MNRAAALPFLVLALMTAGGGCVYYNGLYNAEVAFRRGDDALLRGDAAAARDAWAEATDGAERAWHTDPEGRWADAALLLAAHSAVRGEDPRRARGELAALAALPEIDSTSIARAEVLEGAVLVLERRPARALDLLDRLELSARDREWLAEASLWRARALAALGRFDEAWAAWDAAAIYRNLTGDDISAGVRTETEAWLSRVGVDPAELRDDFVSYQTVRTHLRECLDVDTARESSLSVDDAEGTIEWARSRSEGIIGRTIERLGDTDGFHSGAVDVTHVARVSCADCGASYPVEKFLDRGGCDCDTDGEGR